MNVELSFCLSFVIECFVGTVATIVKMLQMEIDIVSEEPLKYSVKNQFYATFIGKVWICYRFTIRSLKFSN